jgi:hypothetical protein
MGKVDDSAAAAVDGADDAEVNANALVNQQTRPAGPLTTSTVGELDYANKPKISAEKPRLSVNAKPMRQTRINPANPRRPSKTERMRIKGRAQHGPSLHPLGELRRRDGRYDPRLKLSQGFRHGGCALVRQACADLGRNDQRICLGKLKQL